MISTRKRFFQCFSSILNPFFYAGCLSFRLNNQHKIEITFWTIILTNLGRLLGLGSLIAGGIYKVNSHKYSETVLALSPLFQLLGVVELTVSILVFINVSISMEFDKKKHAGIFNRAYELDKIFIAKFNANLNYEHEFRYNTLKTRILMFQCLVYNPICFISLDPDWQVILMAFGYSVCTLGPMASSYTLIMIMDFLRIRFALFRGIFNQYFSDGSSRSKEQQKHVELLLFHYREYCVLIHDINNVYGDAAMASYVHDFTQTSCIMFVLCHKALESNSSALEYLVLFIFVLPRMSKIVYMAFCARATVLEMQSCLQIIATYDDHFTSKHVKDIIYDLIMWSKLNRFEFNVGSALQLNFGLVYEFFLGIGNYVLILIQLKFQETSIKDRLIGPVQNN